MYTLGEMAEFFAASAARTVDELSAVVADVADIATARARTYPGKLQDEWEPLHDATIQGFVHRAGFYIPGKAALGFAPPDYEPLYRKGGMRDSIEPLADGLTGGAVSDSKIMLYQEMGTPDATYPIPPRPVLALAVQRTEPQLVEQLGEVALNLLVPDA